MQPNTDRCVIAVCDLMVSCEREAVQLQHHRPEKIQKHLGVDATPKMLRIFQTT